MTVIVVSFAVYTLFIVGVGLYSAKFARRSDEDYFLAGRSLGPWTAALSASASAESGWVTMGLVGLAFASGMQAYWLIPGVCLGYLFNWFILAARLRDHSSNLGALTLPDLFARHYGERQPILRILSVVVIMVAMLLYVAAQFAAAGKAFDFALADRADYWHGVLIGSGIVLVYTVLGGFRAVCWTDFVQALIMIGALVGFPLYIMATQGGYGFMLEHFRAADAAAGGVAGGTNLVSLLPQKTGLALIGFLLGSSALGVNFGYPGQPHILVRYMGMRDRREYKVAGAIALAWMFMVLWGAVTIGLLARALAESGGVGTEWATPILADLANDKPVLNETALLAAAAHMLPGVMAGLVLAAVLAAICSTADSQLVVAASAAANDLRPRRTGSAGGRFHMLINRLTVFLLGAGAILLVIRQEVNVYSYVLTYGWAVLGAAFGPQLILLLFWKRSTYAGCVAGMLVGFILPIVWANVYDASATGVEIYNLPLSFIAAMIVNMAVSIARPRQGPRTFAMHTSPPDESGWSAPGHRM